MSSFKRNSFYQIRGVKHVDSWEDKQSLRKDLESMVSEFLSNGGEIKKIPSMPFYVANSILLRQSPLEIYFEKVLHVNS